MIFLSSSKLLEAGISHQSEDIMEAGTKFSSIGRVK